MKLLKAPIYALFSRDFYRLVVQEKADKGFKYLAYLSGLALLIVWGAFFFRLNPVVNQAADWLREEMPSMVWTPDGLTMNARSPYNLVHPSLGPIIVLDMTRETILPGDMGDNFIYVTSKSFYMKDGESDLRAYPLTVDEAQRKDLTPEQMMQQIDGETVYNFIHKSKPTLFLLITIIFYACFFIWKLFQVLFISGIGYLINMTLRKPLPYEKIFLLGCFIVTVISLIELRGLFLPALLRLPFGWFGVMLVSAGYYYVVLKACEQDALQAFEENPS